MDELREEIEREKKSNTRQTAWIFLVVGIGFALAGLGLEFARGLQDFFAPTTYRYTPEVHYVKVTHHTAAIMCFVISFFTLLASYGSFKKMRTR